MYSQQLHSGQDYRELRPTYAPWLLGDDLLRDDPAYAHRYRLRDERGRTLLEHGGISLFELSKFATGAVETEEERWLKFFKDGKQGRPSGRRRRLHSRKKTPPWPRSPVSRPCYVPIALIALKEMTE